MAKDWAKSFYNSSEWKSMRLSILSRDKFRCQNQGCFSVAEEVHHIIELNENNINDRNITLNPSNLVSLCSICHKNITRQEKRPSKNILPEIYFDSNGQPITETPPGG